MYRVISVLTTVIVMACHSQGPQLPGFTNPRGRNSQGRNSQGEPLYSVSEHFINPTSVSANHYFNKFQLLPSLWHFVNPAYTDTIIIPHIFSKNSCMRTQILVSVKDALFSSIWIFCAIWYISIYNRVVQNPKVSQTCAPQPSFCSMSAHYYFHQIWEKLVNI